MDQVLLPLQITPMDAFSLSPDNEDKFLLAYRDL